MTSTPGYTNRPRNLVDLANQLREFINEIGGDRRRKATYILDRIYAKDTIKALEEWLEFRKQKGYTSQALFVTKMMHL
jgi:hypothetical protein